jgi:hypothetical protein
LKWLGLILVFTGLGLIPIAVVAFERLQLFVGERDFHVVLILLMVMADIALIAGVLMMMPQRRSSQRRFD